MNPLNGRIYICTYANSLSDIGFQSFSIGTVLKLGGETLLASVEANVLKSPDTQVESTVDFLVIEALPPPVVLVSESPKWRA